MGKSDDKADKDPNKNKKVRQMFEKKTAETADAASDPLTQLLSLPRSEWPSDVVDDERALEILEQFYKLMLENCTDEDDEVDTRTVMELLAGMTGVFMADYAEFYGEQKALDVLRSFIALTVNVYAQRQNP
jgi:hypothetical protein